MENEVTESRLVVGGLIENILQEDLDDTVFEKRDVCKQFEI